MSHRALFLDRDGVINVNHGYVHRLDQVEWVDGIFDLTRAAIGFGLKLIIVTNQAGIGRGYYSEDDFHLLTDWMKARFVEAGAPLTAVYFCPFHPDGLGQYRRSSDRRKPAPGMLLDACRDHRIDLPRSFLVGDQLSDIEAGQAAGLPVENLLLLSDADLPDPPCSIVTSHQQAISWLMSRQPVD